MCHVQTEQSMKGQSRQNNAHEDHGNVSRVGTIANEQQRATGFSLDLAFVLR